MLSIISVLRSYPAAAAQAVSPKPRTSPGRRSGTNATESLTTTAASTKSFTKKSCCPRKHPNIFASVLFSGTPQNRRKPAKTVRLPGVLTRHFRVKFHERSRSTLCGNSVRRISHHTGCASILRFTTRMMEIPMCIFYCRPVA